MPKILGRSVYLTEFENQRAPLAATCGGRRACFHLFAYQ